MERNDLLEWALYLAGMGWPIFPLAPGTKNRPMVKDWENRAHRDTDRIRRCWNTGRFNIAVATGPAGLVVLDPDVPDEGKPGPDGWTNLTALAAERGGPLPTTYTVATPSGGRHLYYLTPAGTSLRNSQSAIAAYVDVRAGGGYAVGPGSVTAAGAYELLDDTDPVELPGWLVQAAAERASTANSAPVQIRSVDTTRYGSAALAGECDRVRRAGPDTHNAVLSAAAYTIGRKVGANLIDHATARAALIDAAGHMVTAGCDCTAREVARVVDAGLSAGARNPVAHRAA
ncbi:bifunctional DNA primase/polymerase [Amycolatopsis sp. NPDC051903]|uniref:bifunctional DNA primase/polymerase n=1 Tax=Amycolatopsis sp. NPDC051903 TaxID=3363936 RepID=UPI0037A8D062